MSSNPTVKAKEKDESENLLKEPLNWTDPIIYHDPSEEIKKNIVAKEYITDDEETADYVSAIDNTKVEGIFYPIIKLNNTVVDKTNIKSMYINYYNFAPTIELLINDYNESIQFSDIPGQNNIITVVLVSPIDGVYKKISLDFVITSWEVSGNTISYYGTYKLLSMNQSKFEGIIYNGCSNKTCNSEKRIYANTWETLHEIAKKSGLGFASTDKCKDVQDRLPRLLQNINYYDYIDSIMEYSGVDLNSMFDCWIDLYGYLVMVNVSWVMKEKIEKNNLSIISTTGFNSNTEINNQKPIEVIRTITNYKLMKVISNMEIEDYTILSSPGVFYKNNSLKTYSIFNPEGVGNNNNLLEQTQIQMVEDSIDGKHTEDYETSEIYPPYFEFNEHPVGQQRERREMYFMKLRAGKIKVIMKSMNFGLQRGTLINVDLFEYAPDKKTKILASSSNLYKENEETNIDIDLKNSDLKDVIIDETIGIINPSISGLYYIDGMEILYNNGKLKQVLYLIKRGESTNFENKYTMSKYGYEADETK